MSIGVFFFFFFFFSLPKIITRRLLWQLTEDGRRSTLRGSAVQVGDGGGSGFWGREKVEVEVPKGKDTVFLVYKCVSSLKVFFFIIFSGVMLFCLFLFLFFLGGN